MKRRNRSLSAGEIAVMAVLMLCLVLAITVTAIRSASRKTQDDGEQFVALEESSEAEDLAQADESTAGNAGGRTQTTDGRDEAAASGENKSTPDKFAVKTAQEEMDLIASAGIAENEIKLGKDEYFVLGDNCNNSEDSRSANVGPVLRSTIVGEAWFHFGNGTDGWGLIH